MRLGCWFECLLGFIACLDLFGCVWLCWFKSLVLVCCFGLGCYGLWVYLLIWLDAGVLISFVFHCG